MWLTTTAALTVPPPCPCAPHHRQVLLFCESGGDNLAANFSRELSDFTIYVIDVAGGDKVPRKGGQCVS